MPEHHCRCAIWYAYILEKITFQRRRQCKAQINLWLYGTTNRLLMNHTSSAVSLQVCYLVCVHTWRNSFSKIHSIEDLILPPGFKPGKVDSKSAVTNTSLPCLAKIGTPPKSINLETVSYERVWKVVQDLSRQHVAIFSFHHVGGEEDAIFTIFVADRIAHRGDRILPPAGYLSHWAEFSVQPMRQNIGGPYVVDGRALMTFWIERSTLTIIGRMY